MQASVDQANWQAAIQRIINQALPNDEYQIICFHQSKSSESLYVDILFENLLFQFRFAFHDRDENNPDLYSFNLRAYPQDHALIHNLQQILRHRQRGTLLTYQHFVALSLIEKLAQFHDSTIQFHDDQFWEHHVPVTKPSLEMSLEFLWSHQLLVIKHATKQVFLSESGQQLLNFYWDVADQYLEEPMWDRNPRTQTPDELRNLS
ncbi:hypothetical protein [uncultured Limosilactobacillus sp.]|uniref:hypothetical protein n=1 Tax=uncultured Limosilactobacillus sp. TaxID=2837629 RepID=UPI0025F0A190|nr:hypothetical protein [uncultured Limosilactobacillus sp.]